MFDRLTSLFKSEQKEIKASPKKVPQREDLSLISRTSYQDIVPSEPTTAEQLRQYRSWIYAALYLRGSMVANMELNLNRIKDDRVEVVKEHPALDLLDRVNNQMTLYGLMKYSSIIRNLTGECYWFMLLDRKGEPLEIYPWLSPANIDVVSSKNLSEFISGYVYSIPGSTEKVPLTTQEVIQFQYPNPTDPYRGQSPIRAAAMAIESDRSSAAWNWRFFKNNGVPRGVLNVKTRYNQSLYEQLRAKWEEGHQGESNANKVAILFSGGGDNDIEFQEIGINQKDMDFLKQREFSRDEILSVLGVPYSILNPAENISRATVEAAQLNFMTNTIIPEMREWVEEINEFLIPKFKNSEGLFFDFTDPTPEDSETKLATYDSGLTYGWLTKDEVRNMEGLPPMEEEEAIRVTEAKPGENMEDDANIGEDQEVKKLKYAKFNVHIKKNRKGTNLIRKINEIVEDKEHLIKRLVKKPAKKEIKKIDKDFEEKGEAFWNKKILTTNSAEENLADDLKKMFSQQSKRIVGTVKTKRVKRVLKEVNYDYDLEAEVTVTASVLEPYYREMITTFGIEALGDLGISKEFETTKFINRYIEKNVLKSATEINSVTKEAIAEQLKIAIEEGESIPQISKRIKDVFKEAGSKRSEMIARTEISRASNAGSYYGYIQSGVVEKVQWWTATDERVCPFCGPMHGETKTLGVNFVDKGDTLDGKLTDEQVANDSKANPEFKADYEAIEHPPLHPRCRCVLLPIVSSTKQYKEAIEKTTRGSIQKEFESKKAELEKEYKGRESELKEKMKELESEKEKLSSLIDKLEDE